MSAMAKLQFRPRHFQSHSMRDLLEVREASSVHLTNLKNEIATGIGYHRSRKPGYGRQNGPQEAL